MTPLALLAHWVRPTLPASASLAALLALGGCLDKYVPDVATPATGYLVVDGFINGNGRSTFKLSRTTSLAATATPPAEKGARLAIEDDAGGRYALTETAVAGTYRSDSLVLAPQRQYQLRIVAASGATYASDRQTVQQTPAIDRLTWTLRNERIDLQVSTHDATRQAQYYRWDLTETWQFNSAYYSQLEYTNNRMQFRGTPIYTCWRTEQPSAIKQATTAQLAQSALTDVLLASPSAHDERFKVRYSVLVTQVAESASEFAYYELLRKNTEAVGTVNDPLPAQLTGNVHRTDATTGEPVLGFVGAHTVQRQRLFISRADLPVPLSWVFASPYEACSVAIEGYYDSIVSPPKKVLQWPQSFVFRDASQTPIAIIKSPNGRDTLGYSGSSTYCVDCRVRGTLTKPSFW